MGEKIDLEQWTGYRGDMGRDVKQQSVFCRWRDVEVMLHCSTLLNAEQHRRLIGNDVGVVLWRPAGAPPLKLDELDLGTVQQVYAVIQPVDDATSATGKALYRAAFFWRTTVRGHGPSLPVQHLLTLDELRPILLCRMANLICEALVHASPMNMLFYKPRGSTIGDASDAIAAAMEKRRRAGDSAAGDSAGESASTGGDSGSDINEFSALAPSGADGEPAGRAGESLKKLLALSGDEKANRTLVVCVTQATHLVDEVPARPCLYAVVRFAGTASKSPARAGPLPIFVHRVPLQLSGRREQTNEIVVELWRQKQRRADICVGEWRVSLHTVLHHLVRRRDIAAVLHQRAVDVASADYKGELMIQFELMGDSLHRDGNGILPNYSFSFLLFVLTSSIHEFKKSVDLMQFDWYSGYVFFLFFVE